MSNDLKYRLGGVALLAGDRYPYRDAARKTLTPVGWVLLGFVAVLSLAAFVGMRMLFEQYGYR